VDFSTSPLSATVIATRLGLTGLATSAITGTLTLTKTGTTARTVTFPDAAITVARIDAAQTFTGQSTFTDGILTTHADAATSAGVHIGNATHQDVAIFGAGGSQGTTLYGQLNGTAIDLTGAAGLTTRQAATQDAVSLLGRAGGTGSYVLSLTPTTLTASRTVTFPDAAITVAGSASALTSGRVPFVTTGGLLTDSANLTWSGSALGVAVSQSATTSIAVSNVNGGVAALAAMTVSNDASLVAAITMAGSAFTGNRFGVARANSMFVGSTGAISSLSIGCVASSDIIFGTNDTERMRIAGTGAITCTGAVTVPNGTAAAPGIRLTGEAHGLYRGSSTSIGFAAAGTAALLVRAPTGTVGTAIELQCPSATERARIGLSATDSWLSVGAGAGSAAAGQVRLYGNTHATKANYVEFTRGDTVSAFFDGSGILTVNNTTDATTTSDGSVRLSGGLSVAKSLVTGNARKIGVRSVTSAAGTTTLDGTDHLAVCAGSTTQTFTLPAASTGRVLLIKNRSTGNLTVNRAGSDTIDGTTSVVLTAGQSLHIVANGTDWVIL